MNKEEWLKSLEDKLLLPKEYRKEIVAEFESHLYQSQFDSKFEFKQLGNINLLINQIMKSRKLKTIDYLKLISTWKLVLVLIFAVVIPIYITMFYVIVYTLSYYFYAYVADMVNQTKGTDIVMLTIVSLILLIISFFALKFASKFISKYKDYKQVELAFSMTFLLILLYFINNSGLSFFNLIFAGDFQSLANRLILNLVGITFWLVVSYLIIVMSRGIKLNLNLFGILIRTLFIVSSVVIFSYMKDLGTNKIGNNLASPYMDSVEYIYENFNKYLAYEEGFDYKNDPYLAKFDIVALYSNQECWDIDESTGGCEYATEKVYIIDESCQEWHISNDCNVLSLYDDSDGLRYDLNLENGLFCYGSNSENQKGCGLINL